MVSLCWGIVKTHYSGDAARNEMQHMPGPDDDVRAEFNLL